MVGRTVLAVATVGGLLLFAASFVSVESAAKQSNHPSTGGRQIGSSQTSGSQVGRPPSDDLQQHNARMPVYRSPNHVCLSADRLYAYIVNQTADSVSVVDVRAREVVGEIPVGRFPTHAAVSADGRKLLVTSHYGYTVDVVDLEGLRVVRSIPAGYEPYGVTVSSDGGRVYVANSLSDTVSIIDAEYGRTLFEVPVGRNPRFIAEVPGGRWVIVTCGLGRCVSIIDTVTGSVVEQRDLDKANLLRQVVCSGDGRWAFVAHVVSQDKIPTLQMERGFIHANGFSVLDLQQPGHRVTLLLDRLLAGAANPWGLTLSPDNQRLYVSLAGVHEIAIVDCAEVFSLVSRTEPDQVERLSQDVEILDRLGIMHRVDAGGIGPRGIALSEATGELLVANYFSDTVSVLDAETGRVRAVIPLGPPQEPTLWRKGQMLFNDARLCYQTWYSCASCHREDATMDGLTWDLSNDGLGNPKNAKSMHDSCDTPPAMWTGVRSDMDAAVAAGQRFLGFLPDPENHKALMAFIGTPRRAPNPYRDRDPEALRRGRRVFLKARCQLCHPTPLYTDLRTHNLGLATETDLKSRFDTPSLRECYRTGPYLRDGRAATLREIFTRHNPEDRHGRTSRLTQAEMDDVVKDEVIGRITLKPPGEPGSPGLSPYRLTMHPDGRFLLVTNRFSNFASVIDTRTDAVVFEVPTDFYCQGVAFDKQGRTAYVANRYLDQVFVIDVRCRRERFRASMRELGGLDDKAFFGEAGKGGIHEVLVRNCGTSGCHGEPRGGFLAGPDPLESFLSTIPHVRPGDSAGSRLLRAVVSAADGGYADLLPKHKSHAAGTVVFKDPRRDPGYRAIAEWIDAAAEGPGIPVGNPRSKPKICTLTTDGRYLLVGNTGTQDISIVDTKLGREVGGIYLQNVVNDMQVYRSPDTGHDYLLVTTEGIGFGVAKERDPYGGESWDRDNPAAQFSVWRDLDTARVLPKHRQEVLGPFDAVDSTAEIKFRDVQNDVVMIDLDAIDIPRRPPTATKASSSSAGR